MSSLTTVADPSQLNVAQAQSRTANDTHYIPNISPVGNIQPYDALRNRRVVVPNGTDVMKDYRLVIQETLEIMAFESENNKGWLLSIVAPIENVGNVKEVRVTHTEWSSNLMTLAPPRVPGTIGSHKTRDEVYRLRRFVSNAVMDTEYLLADTTGEYTTLVSRQLFLGFSDTVLLQALQAMYASRDSMREFYASTKTMSFRDYMSALDFDRLMFGVIHKSDKGFQTLEVECDRRHRRVGGNTDVIVVPKMCYDRAFIEQPAQYAVSISGPRGERVFDSQTPVNNVYGKRIFIARTVELEDYPRIEPFSRDRQVGLGAMMEWTNYGADYKSSDMDRQIMDWGSRDWRTVTLRDAVNAQAALFQGRNEDKPGYIRGITTDGIGRVTSAQRVALTRSPFHFQQDIGGNNAWFTATAIGDMSFADVGREYWRAIGRRVDPAGTLRRLLFGAPNIFGNQAQTGDSTRARNLPNRIGSNISSDELMDTFYANIGLQLDTRRISSRVFDAMIAMATENEVASQMQSIKDGRGAVMNKIDRMAEVLRENIGTGTRVTTEAALETAVDKIKQRMQQTISGSAGANRSPMDVDFDSLPAFNNQQSIEAQVGLRQQPIQAQNIDDEMDLFDYQLRDNNTQFEKDNTTREGFVAGGTRAVGQWRTFFESIRGGNADVYALQMAVAGMPLTKNTLLTMVDLDLPLPFNVILARPHGRFKTQGVSRVMSGGAAGKTFLGSRIVDSGKTVESQRMTMQFVAYMGTYFYNPKYLWNQPDVCVQEYLSGMGTIFFNEKANYDPNNPGTFGNRSIFAILVPAGYNTQADENRRINFPMSLTGSWSFQYDVNGPGRVHYPTVDHYAGYWGWKPRARILGHSLPLVMGGNEPTNYIIYRDSERHRSSRGGWEKVVHSNGHLGDVGQGTCDMFLSPLRFTSIHSHRVVSNRE